MVYHLKALYNWYVPMWKPLVRLPEVSPARLGVSALSMEFKIPQRLRR